MDNKKKEKLVAIIVTTLLSLAISLIACAFGISPDMLPDVSGTLESKAATYCIYDTSAFAGESSAYFNAPAFKSEAVTYCLDGALVKK